MGVSFFFTLSGFLITYLLLKEKEYTNTIHVRSFYVRRILRIWPLYYFCVFFGFVIFPMLKQALGQVPDEHANIVLCALFLNNFDILKNGMPDSFVLQVLWSVAIEEQFYLVWPVLFFLVPERYYMWIFIVPCALSVLFRTMHIGDTLNADTHTFGVISDMAIGGLGAFLTIKNKRFFEIVKCAPQIFCIMPYIVVCLFMLFKPELFSAPVMFILKRFFWSFFFIWIILEQNFSENSMFKISSLKKTSVLGKYTYGLYCLHTIAFIFIINGLKKIHLSDHIWQIWIIEIPLCFIASVLLAYGSFHYFEKRFLKYKNRFAYIIK